MLLAKWLRSVCEKSNKILYFLYRFWSEVASECMQKKDECKNSLVRVRLVEIILSLVSVLGVIFSHGRESVLRESGCSGVRYVFHLEYASPCGVVHPMSRGSDRNSRFSTYAAGHCTIISNAILPRGLWPRVFLKGLTCQVWWLFLSRVLMRR